MTEEQIKEIAGNLDCGFSCYIHRVNKDIKFIQGTDQHPDMEELGAWKNDIKAINKDKENYVEISGLDSRESYQLMTEFVDTVEDANLQEILRQALGRPKPFRNFKIELSQNDEYRGKWFMFKEPKLIEFVEEQIDINGL